MRRISRRTALGGFAGIGAVLAGGAARAGLPILPREPADAPLGMALTEAQRAAGARFLARYPSVDIHCHPGRFFLEGVVDPSPRIAAYGNPFEARAIADMNAGQLSAGLFAGVSDMALLEFSPTKGLYAIRDFAPGEAWADYRRQIGTLKGLVEQGTALPGRTVADIAAAHRARRTAAVFSIEGGDFIEDRLERVHQAYADGVRAITIVHYHVNQIGDIQTAPAYHGGLTTLGGAIVREMNRAGIIVDLAHAPDTVVRGAVDIATRPMMISHSNLNRPDVSHPRLISDETARLVASTGGIIGSVPSGIGQSTFAEWIDAILRLVDVVGPDHAAIGTDMDANYMPVFTDYRLWYLIPAALLARGMHEQDVAKLIGGNFLRLFRTVLSS
jgi:membrane dipeptidase